MTKKLRSAGRLVSIAALSLALGAAPASAQLPAISGSITIGAAVNLNGQSCPSGQDIFNSNGVIGCHANGVTTLTVGSTPTSGGGAGQIMYDTGSVLQESSGLVYVSPGQLTLTGAGGFVAAPLLTTNAAGGSSTPILTLDGDSATGWYRNSANQWTWSTGTNWLSLISATLRMASTEDVCWSSAANSTTACDTSVTRSAAGVVAAGTGAQGSTAGTFSATGFTAGGLAGAAKTATLNTANMVTGCTLVFTAGILTSTTGPC